MDVVLERSHILLTRLEKIDCVDTLSQESLVGAFCSPAEQTDLTDLAKQFYLQRAIPCALGEG